MRRRTAGIEQESHLARCQRPGCIDRRVREQTVEAQLILSGGVQVEAGKEAILRAFSHMGKDGKPGAGRRASTI